MVRTRFAPSPTGLLHIGSARSALFNWLFARQHKGVFILRIEDTDKERSKPEYEKDILESFKWLGIDYDDGPYRQSERLDLYEKYLKKLLDAGLAYYCFCTKEELEREREKQLKSGRAPRYDGKCRTIDSGEAEKRRIKGKPCVVRFRVPASTRPPRLGEAGGDSSTRGGPASTRGDSSTRGGPDKKVAFRDLIRGEVTFDAAEFGDFVIAKDLRQPLYNFAATVDDYEMKISHVIRGEEHLANTPRQILLQEALGFSSPEYAHLPLILNPDRSKMSKRFEATAVAEYKAAGYLPDALVNFLVLLGWHPKDDREILTRDELVKKFDISRSQKAGAVFDVKKLNWMNGHYIRRTDDAELLRMLNIEATEQNKKIIALVKDRMEKLAEFKELAGFFYELPEYSAELLQWQETPMNVIKVNLEAVRDAVAQGASLEPLVKKLGTGETLWPLRVALSGLRASPGPYEIMDALGKEETLRRIEIAIKKLKS